MTTRRHTLKRSRNKTKYTIKKTHKKSKTRSKKYSTFTFSNNISKLNVKSSNDSVKVLIDDPILMSNTEKVLQVYKNNVRLTKFNGVTALLDNDKYPSVFGTNIDTIFFCYALSKNHKYFENIKNFFELGTGGGFISKYIVSKFNNIKDAYLCDVNPESIKYVSTDLELPILRKQREKTYKITTPFNCTITEKNGYTYYLGDGLGVLDELFIKKDISLDLLICNPPYIPKSDGELDLDRKNPNFFEGTRLLRYLLQEYKSFSKKMVIIISSTSFLNKLVIKALQNVNFKVLLSHEVPLKVWNQDKGAFLSDDKKYVKFLTSSNKTITIKGTKFQVGALPSKTKPYPLYHIVNVVYVF